MGSQLAGGINAQVAWRGSPDFVQVRIRTASAARTLRSMFLKTLDEQGVAAGSVCGVMSETYQGCNAALMPPEYAQALRRWCDEAGALLIFDEVQAGFGRTGGCSGSGSGWFPALPASERAYRRVAPVGAGGTDELMEMWPGEMTSTLGKHHLLRGRANISNPRRG